MELKIPTPNGEIDGYLSVPMPAVSGADPWPGVVVLPDVLGMSADVRAIADRFATAGYLALVVNQYSRGGFLRCIRSIFEQVRAGTGPAFDDIEAARELLAGRPDCTGKVGVTGFCMGGGFALLAAPRGFDASAPYYGMVPDDPSLLAGACPVVASFGARDRGLRGAADRLRGMLTELGVPNDIKEYPDAGHSFANQMPLGPLNVVLKVAFGMGFHHESSQDSWRRVMTFFATYLR